jgi:NAD(P)-dependent dehydrogenase (short-subunit alcohol dehydrogenase family)
MNDAPFIDFSGRWVVVAGASSGIGRAIAVELARRSARLVLVGRDEMKLQETLQQLPSGTGRVVIQDLRATDAIVPLVRDHVKDHGRIYGLCYCAGVVETRPLASFKPDSFRDMIEVNVTGALELSKAVSRRDVVTEEGGALLFIASVYGSVGMPGQIGYSATKGALLAAVRSMAVELARRRIRVNALSPGLVHTAMTEGAFASLSKEQVRELESSYPLGAGKPEDVARAAAFLLAPENGWITGTDFVVDGGYTAQ